MDLSEHAETILTLIPVLLGFFGFIVLAQAGYTYLGWAVYIISVAVVALIPVFVREIVNKYPYIQLIVRPDNVRLHLYIQKDESFGRCVDRERNIYESNLKLAYPIRYADIPKTDRVILLHRGKLLDRVFFRPGSAIWRGILIQHPQTEIIDVAPAPKSVTMDHGQPVPVFYVLLASKDRVAVNPLSPPVDTAVLLDRIRQLELELAKARRDALEWQQKALAYEEVIEQQKAETSGLLETKVGVKEHALELVLGLYNAFGRFDRVVEKLGGRRLGLVFNKYVAITIIAVAVILFLWSQPQITSQLIAVLSNPVIAILLLIIVIVVAYYMYKGGRGK